MRIGTSYFGNRMIHHFNEDLDSLISEGFTDILHTVSENDLKFYRNTIKDFIQLSKAKGLTVTVSPWSYGLVFGGEAFSEFAFLYPDACQKTQHGVTLPNACFNHSAFVAYMKNWIDHVIEMGADYILWDEPHWAGDGGWYPLKNNEWSCRCQTCQHYFERMFNEPMPYIWSNKISIFQKESMVRFIKEVSEYSKEKGCKNIICFFPNRKKLEVPSEWKAIASLDSIDIFATDPYWVNSKFSHEELVHFYVAEAVKIGEETNKEVQLYIQNFKIPTDEEYKVKEAVEIGLSYGITYFFTWGFQSCKHMSFLASENPELAFMNFYKTLRC